MMLFLDRTVTGMKPAHVRVIDSKGAGLNVFILYIVWVYLFFSFSAVMQKGPD
jgi:hypothetical protein